MLYSARARLSTELDRPASNSAAARVVTTSRASHAAREVSFLPHDELANRIRERIETRLPGRVRELRVNISKNTVVLDGSCSTFYTKQLAQHAAMGVLEFEKLRNNISVSRPR